MPFSFSIIENIWKVATWLYDAAAGFQKAQRDKRDRLALLMEQIAACLETVVAKVRMDENADGECEKMNQYSEALPPLLVGHFTEVKAQEIADTLRSSYAVETLAIELRKLPDNREQLAELTRAAGKFKALADILRAQ